MNTVIKNVIFALSTYIISLLFQNQPNLFKPWIIYELVALILESLLLFFAILVGLGGGMVIFLMFGIGKYYIPCKISLTKAKYSEKAIL